MIYLIFSVGSSTIILILFRLFKSFKIDTKQAIVVNYISAFLFGLWSYDEPVDLKTILQSEWIYGAIALGLLFITIFNLMAITAQKNGISVVSVASKMSVVIPITLGVFIFNEALSISQIIGIILALFAVYLVSQKKEDSGSLHKSLLYPFLVFLGSGIIDGSLKYFESNYLSQALIPLFSSSIFLFAAIFGFTWIIGFQKHKLNTFNIKSITAGSILGVVNYFSIYFLIQALKINWLNSATIFTINNVSIVAISSIIGFIVFKESISKSNFIGILLAVISIYLISLEA